MRIIFIISNWLLSFFSPCFVNAQQVRSVQELTDIFTPAPLETTFEVSKENRNEIELFLSGMFLFYKNFISSQDGASCTFTPSCSEYCVLSVKQHGFFMGLADTFDRLTRCNGMSPEKYIRNPRTGLFNDVPDILNQYHYYSGAQQE